jgi:hypothetical protein
VAPCRAEDGRGPATDLAPAMAAYFGLPSVTDVAIAVHKGKLGEDDLLRLRDRYRCNGLTRSP